MKSKLLLLLFLGSFVYGQENLSYQKPPQEILALADYERAPSVSISANKEYMLLSYRNTYKTLDDLNQEEMRLGGLRINPVTNISSTVTYINNLKIRKLTDKNEIQVKGLPENSRISNLSTSINQKKIAFSNTTSTGVELWVIDVASAQATQLTEATVNANMGNPFSWFTDNEHILVRMLVKNRPALIDEKKDLPTGPIVSSGDGSVSQNRTYQDLLKNPSDEQNFETLVTSELYKISITGKASLFMKADMYSEESISPDGNFIMISTIEKPFSYIVPLNRFPEKTVVCDKDGKEIKVVNQTPLIEVMPKGFSSTRKGKRSFAWRNDKPATLYFVEALDEGDQAKKVEFRDELFVWDAPFINEPTSLMKMNQRYAGIQWGDETTAIVMDRWYDTRNMKTYLLNPSKANQKAQVIFERNYQDIYADQGSFETKKNEFGKYVLLLENNSAYLIGQGFTKEGQFPFIDE